MPTWTRDELTKIAAAEELELASVRRDDALGNPVTIWVVRVADNLYVRSWKGDAGAWFRATQARHIGHIEGGGVGKDIQVNLKGVWLCMKAELEQMVRQGGGSIVNTASLAGLTGFKTTAGYAASKHGVIGLTKTAAIEYAPGIRVNCVCPGFADTDMLRDTMARRGGEILARVPFGELARPDDVAEMVCWLSSDRVRYVSGAVFIVDGAYMAD